MSKNMSEKGFSLPIKSCKAPYPASNRSKKFSLCLGICLSLVTLSSLAQEVEPGEWRVLFDGSSIDGLVVEPATQAEFVTVDEEDGVIRIFGSTEGGWLRTDRKYADFTMAFDIRFLSGDEVHGRTAAANNGLILRSPEITISGRNWPGRGFEMEMWDQSRRNGFAKHGTILALQPGAPGGPFSFDIAAAKRSYVPSDVWSTVEVIAHGNKIWTKFNGEWLSINTNAAHPDGHVGYQIEDGITEVRNIRIMEHAEDTWTPVSIVPLFGNGELTDFGISDAAYAGNVSIQNGILRVEGEGGWLKTDHMYTSYTLRAQVRFPEGSAGSGVYLRAYGNEANEDGSPLNTDEVQMLTQRIPPPTGAAGDARWFGTLLSHGTAGGRASVDTGLVVDAYRQNGEWQDVTVEVDGDNVSVTLNGILIAKGDDVANLDTGGYVGIQIDGGVTEFRRIEIQGLRKE